MLLTYFLNDFEIVAPIITGIASFFTLHMRCLLLLLLLFGFSYPYVLTLLSEFMSSQKYWHFVVFLPLNEGLKILSFNPSFPTPAPKC